MHNNIINTYERRYDNDDDVAWKREEVMGGGRKLRSRGFFILYSSPNIVKATKWRWMKCKGQGKHQKRGF
jgi:hypothetical protein